MTIYCGFPFVDLTAIPEELALKELDRIETSPPSFIVEFTAVLDFLDPIPMTAAVATEPSIGRQG